MLAIGIAIGLMMALPPGGNTPAAGASGGGPVVIDSSVNANISSIAIGADDNPAIVYSNLIGGSIRVAHCGNPTCTGGNTLTTISTVGGIHFARLAKGSDGLPFVITFHDSGSIHCGNFLCSADNTPGAAGGNMYSLAIGADGYPVISSYGTGLEVIHCTNVICSSISPVASVDPGAYTSSSIEQGADGLPVIAYTFGTGSLSLKVVHCGDTTCSSGNTISTVDSSVSDIGSLAIGSDGLPDIVYQGAGLIFAHCSDIICSSRTTVLIDSSGGAGSMARGSDGNAVISYYAGGLKVAHCIDLDCSSSNITTLDNTGGNCGGGISSVAIGNDGYPVVSYCSGNSLKFVHCVNLDCSPKPTPTPPDSPTPTATPTPNPTADDDSDGIENQIDALPNTPSDNFSDVYLGGQTYGTLFRAPGMTLTVSDLAFPNGVRIVASGAGGPSPVVIFCHPQNEIYMSPGMDETITCASADVHVLAGSPINWFGSLIAKLGPGADVGVTEPSPGVYNVADQGPAAVTVGGVTIAPGGTATGLVDSDADGLADSAEWSLGSNPNDSDTDGDGIGDGLETAMYGSSPLLTDSDGDGLADPTEVGKYHTSPALRDTDGDRCSDGKEVLTSSGSQVSGGRRDPLNPWDYFNPTHDGQNRVDDILAVVQHYGKNTGDPGYSTDYDRTYIGPDLWNLGPPNGKIRVDDILEAIYQYHHDCA